jgi:hypothetical protein
MTAYAERAFEALNQLNDGLIDFDSLIRARPADPPRLPRKTLDDLIDIAARARTGVDALRHSLSLIEQTSLDVVDMQVRLQGEAARLASALKDLGRAIEKQHFVREAFEAPLVALDEAAQSVASAIFPSAVRGLREVNVKLWEFEKILYKRYTDLLTDVVRAGRLTPAQHVTIQRIADDVVQAFAEVNTLLNDLAENRSIDAVALRARLDAAPRRLTKALQRAESRVTDAVHMFAPVIKASAKVAEAVAGRLEKLEIPLFPRHEGVRAVADVIDRDLYESLSGVQAFALLNILARMVATTANGRPLVDGRAVRVTRVFPDRIYLGADESLMHDLSADADAKPPTKRQFTKAPASLHRFNDVSFKQTTYTKGNLQLSIEKRGDGRIDVDADIDLYRAAVPHLFGEVLVNHLTGSSTDQFDVRRILDDQGITPVAEFRLLAMA